MGVVRFVKEQRDKQIVAQARPYLSEGEKVVGWVRAHEFGGKRRGYVFLTHKRLVVHWVGGSDGRPQISWHEVSWWGVSDRSEGPPIVGVETEEESVVFEVRLSNQRAVDSVKDFLRRFARLAPAPRQEIRRAQAEETFAAKAEVEVKPKRRSWAGHTKRIVVTIIGATVLLVGILIIPLPGPWSAPLILGGLAILASEYDWAEDTMNWAKEKMRRAREKIQARRSSR